MESNTALTEEFLVTMLFHVSAGFSPTCRSCCDNCGQIWTQKLWQHSWASQTQTDAPDCFCTLRRRELDPSRRMGSTSRCSIPVCRAFHVASIPFGHSQWGWFTCSPSDPPTQMRKSVSQKAREWKKKNQNQSTSASLSSLHHTLTSWDIPNTAWFFSEELIP